MHVRNYALIMLPRTPVIPGRYKIMVRYEVSPVYPAGKALQVSW